MNNYRFYVEKNKYIWENGIIKLEFSKPSIQPHDSYKVVNDSKEIMYYYYTMKVFYIQEKYVDSDNDEDDLDIITSWKLLTSQHTHDFPCIRQFACLLDNVLNNPEPLENGQKVSYRSGKVKYMFNYFTEGFGCDDFYQITRIANENDNDESWILYLGTSFDVQSDENSIGIRTPYLKRTDIEELYNCVTSFIQYSIDDYNKYIIKRLKSSEKDFLIKDNKLYHYEDGKLDSIFLEGDNVDVTLLKDKTFTMHSEGFYNLKIISIKDGVVTFENGYEVSPGLIAHIFYDVPDNVLSYDLEDCAREASKILSPDEIQEFLNNDVNYLKDKYGNALYDRVWLYRDEHNFPQYDYDDREKIFETFIEDIIKFNKE